MRTALIFGIAALVVTGLSGCDSDSLDDFLPETRELSIETTLLPLGLCRTIVNEVHLFAGDEFLGKAKIDIGGEVKFNSVRIPPGQFEFELRVEVTSVIDSVIFEGRLRRTGVTDGFEYELIPTAITPVMEVCIPDDSQSFVVKNRGSGSVRFQLLPEGPTCLSGDPSCLVLTVSGPDVAVGDTVAAGETVAVADSVVVRYSVNSDSPESIKLHIKSVQGGVWMNILPSAIASKRGVVSFTGHRSDAL